MALRTWPDRVFGRRRGKDDKAVPASGTGGRPSHGRTLSNCVRMRSGLRCFPPRTLCTQPQYRPRPIVCSCCPFFNDAMPIKSWPVAPDSREPVANWRYRTDRMSVVGSRRWLPRRNNISQLLDLVAKTLHLQPNVFVYGFNLRRRCCLIFAVFLCDSLHDPRRECCGDHTQQADAAHHEQNRDHSTRTGRGHQVAVPDGGYGGDRPPHCVTEVGDLRAGLSRSVSKMANDAA